MTKHIDFAGVKAAEASIAAVLSRRPDIRLRTQHFLSGELSPDDMELLMAEHLTRTIPLRLPDSIIERADKLKDVMAEVDELAAVGRVARTSVLRLAILKGLEVLEAEHLEKK